MTAEDFAFFRMYTAKRGPMNPTLRADRGFALLASITLSAANKTKEGGVPYEPSDFMPWAKDEAPEEPATVESAFQLFKSLAKPKRTDK